MILKMLSADEKLAEIKRLYYQTRGPRSSRISPRRSIC